jgi:deoxyhypusine synthase
MKSVRQFMDSEFKHFNARETRDAAIAWENLIESGGKMLLTMAGAMSSAELGISLAEMIRRGFVHGISCTAANLEEEIFNLFAHDEYKLLPNYRDLTPKEETSLYEAGYNRVTDTAIPETIFYRILDEVVDAWSRAAEKEESRFPYEYLFDLIQNEKLKKDYQIDPKNSWLVAAMEAGIPIYSPGFEDSTMGNIYTAMVINGRVKNHRAIRSGTEQMEHLGLWYKKQSDDGIPVGFFQIGGGIAGDFAICAVPMLIQDLELDVRYWAYFAQISDSTTSYGSYSGAVPNEKITWGKLDESTPKFMINSDASIVAPLIFNYILEG